jgi:hypothetical protein
MGNFGEAPNLLEQFHYLHFRGHNIHSRENDRRSRAIELAVHTYRKGVLGKPYLAAQMRLCGSA